jgi:hypothetical protein
MARTERTRDVLRGSITGEYLELRMQGGWRPVAVEWERSAEEEAPAPAPRPVRQEVPFGLRVAGDCLHLEENPAEMEILTSMMELMIQDISLTRLAEELNRRGFPTRDGRAWNAATVFRLLPRVIEVAPRIFSGEEWEVRRKRLAPVTWNS